MISSLFIHIPKNAGLTVRRSPLLRGRIALANMHINPDYTKRLKIKMDSLNDHHGNEHSRLIDVHPKLRELQPFAIVRNPWDRVVSRYFFARKVIFVEKKQPASYADVRTFESFLEERHKWKDQEFLWHRAVRGWYPAYDYVQDEKGINRCDIIRFEHLNEDLCKYFNLYSMSEARNVTGLNRGTYKDLYNSKTIQIIADWYKKDIDYWGYDFDTGPTRNYWNA